MIETASQVLHLTESFPLSVYNRLFSRQPEPNGAVCYYDATMDDYFDGFLSSRASEITIEEEPEPPLFIFD